MLARALSSAAKVSAAVPMDTVQFNEAYIDETNAANYTFNNVNIGTPYVDREVFIVSQVRHSTTGAINSITIGGVSATVNSYTTPSPPIKLLIARAVVPTGTTGTVSINTGATADRCTIFSYSVYRASPSATLTDSITAAAASGATSYTSTALTTNAGGVSFGIITKSTTGSYTVSGVTPSTEINVTEAAGVLISWYTNNILGGTSVTPTINFTWTSAAATGVYGGAFA